jgi:heme-degrading monooxygenase HmoA
MITEIAILKIKPNQKNHFEEKFNIAKEIISKSKGYINHEILKCIELQDQYILIVRWENLEDHTIGFRKSVAYQEWKKLLHDFYDPFPEVLHYEDLIT